MKNFLHENLPYESFFTRKFPDLWYSDVCTACACMYSLKLPLLPPPPTLLSLLSHLFNVLNALHC